jgi:hypothetical protein
VLLREDEEEEGGELSESGDSQAIADDHFSDVERRTPVYSV